MKFCQHCGTEKKPSDKFCKSCGTPFTVSSAQQNNEPPFIAPTSPLTDLKHKWYSLVDHPIAKQVKPTLQALKTKSLLHKKQLLITLGVIVGIVLIFFMLNLLFTNEGKLTKNLTAAAENQDVETFMKALELSPYSDEEVDAHKALLETDNVYYLANDLIHTIEFLSDNGDVEQSSVVSSEYLTGYTVQKSKRLGLFEFYEIIPSEVELTAYTSMDEITLSLNKQTHTLVADEDTLLTPFLPGIYTYELTFDSPFGEIKQTHTADITTMTQTLYITPEMYEVLIDNDNYYDFSYFANDNLIDSDYYMEYSSLYVPVGAAFDLTATFKVNEKAFTSEKVAIKKSTSVELVFPEYEQQLLKNEEQQKQQALADQHVKNIEKLLSNYFTAYTSGDPTLLEAVIDQNVEFYKEQTEQMNRLIEQGTTVELVATDNFEVTAISDETFKASLNEVYTVTKADGSSKEVKQHCTYTITISGEKYYIIAFEMN